MPKDTAAPNERANANTRALRSVRLGKDTSDPSGKFDKVAFSEETPMGNGFWVKVSTA
jgi:hypothetical protein